MHGYFKLAIPHVSNYQLAIPHGSYQQLDCVHGSYKLATPHCFCQLANHVYLQDFILQKIGGSAVSMWWIGLSNIPRKDTKDYKWTDGKDLDTKIL